MTDNTWTETGITYSNAPTMGSQLGSSGAISAKTWTTVDVTSYITGNGTHNFAFTTTSNTNISFSSREGANAPQLVIETSTGATNTPTATATPGPTPTPTKTSTPGGTNTPTVPPTVTPTTQPTFQNATFIYDGDGKRVKSIINSAITTYFVGAHYEVSGSTVTKYYYAGAQRIAMRSNGTLQFLIGDHLGSTSLTTNASGQVVSEVRYKAWGEVRYASGNVPTKYQYTGQYNDSYINLLWYGSRHYDPYLNQFTQPDTIVPDLYNPQDWNRYSYARNNPLRYTDPDGHFPIIPIIALVGIFFIFNGTSDSYRPNLSTAELESRQTSVELGAGITLSALSIQAPVVELISNTYDCATGYCNPSLILPGSSHAYGNAAEELLDDTDTLITRTYTYGDESFEYVFDPNKPAALGYTEDLAHLSPDDYNLLRVPNDIYDNTSVQRDFMRDIVESGVYPQILSNPNDQPWRIFSRYEMKLLDRFERRFGKWFE